jgi:hypothetical protein
VPKNNKSCPSTTKIIVQSCLTSSPPSYKSCSLFCNLKQRIFVLRSKNAFSKMKAFVLSICIFFAPFNPIHILTPYSFKINLIIFNLDVSLIERFNTLKCVQMFVPKTRKQPTKLPKNETNFKCIQINQPARCSN